ncbi:MAG: hypothetical protein IKE16_11705 [Solobacterium sp.]|nr:hypothetical protein [Solobacterium sp.]MBR3179014.1 hypothetical protein [Clostridia bacterium]
MDEKKNKAKKERLTTGNDTVLEEVDLQNVSGGNASYVSKKWYRCPKCGGFCYPTGTGVNIGSSSYYPVGLHWHYECSHCGELYLECELDGTVEPRI